MGKKAVQLGFNKSPQVERILETPLVQGLGQYFQPITRTAQQEYSKKK
jgi:hypothetical protein